MAELKHTSANMEEELKAAIKKIVISDHPKKVILAGPGAGKTTLFKELLEKNNDGARSQLVLTFINNLKDELDEKLGHLAQVFTFHGYCVKLLHENPNLREGLSEKFKIFPNLPTLIKRDWEILHTKEAPKFVGNMRNTLENAESDFYLSRSNYYDTVSFDDSIFRVHSVYSTGKVKVPRYKLVLVDEYQDFNRLEVSLIDLLSLDNSIAVAGDDDQALYSQLKGASYEFIRHLWRADEFENCELPFCLRCPEVIVNSFADVIEVAKQKKLLPGRIDKPYKYFEPYRRKDSTAHPKIKVLEISAQQLKTNYLGRTVAHIIKKIPKEYITESIKDKFPTALVIGPKQYLSQIAKHLQDEGFIIDYRAGGEETTKITHSMALPYLKENPNSNIGWRIALEADNPNFSRSALEKAVKHQKPLFDEIEASYRDALLSEAEKWEKPVEIVATQHESEQPTIKLTSYEGAKGLSAQFVFIVGLHNGDLPRDPNNIKELEIFRFLVALTRTRKQCYFLWANRFAGKPMRPSEFLRWIDKNRLSGIRVDKDVIKRLN
ncbi:MAG: AAA family ATPase [bacterium]|nr:AAA family ATPase [bacterium]